MLILTPFVFVSLLLCCWVPPIAGAKCPDYGQSGVGPLAVVEKGALIAAHSSQTQIALVAIAGAFRKGKSFLLNFLLRYLSHLSHLTSNSGQRMQTLDWLDASASLQPQFRFKGGHKLHTEGILLWPEPFLLRDRNGQEVAVLLMDTQGSFDDRSSVRDNALIFSLSTMVASTLIYNLDENIGSNDLQHLQFFAKYGELALGDESGVAGSTPFQSLLFLVRDWAWDEGNMTYGVEGGEALLNERLKVSELDTAEMRRLKTDIRSKLFHSVRCFLMPHPGPIVGNSKPRCFAGNLTDVDSDFLTQIRALTAVLFDPGELAVKRILNEYVSGRELLEYFKAYFGELNSSGLDAASLYTTTARTQCQIAVESVVVRYRDSFQKELEHREVSLSIEEMFNAMRLMADSDIVAEYRQQLKQQIDGQHSFFASLNAQMRRQEEQNDGSGEGEQQQAVRELLEENERLKEEKRQFGQKMQVMSGELAQGKERERERQLSQCQTKQTVGGSLIGGLIGFLIGGPPGALIGAAGTAVVGYNSC